ncbi:MAG: apolipoprotein N-acyltransferase [Alphaproteobacteria bacterium]|nr:apolipoprotein N-acyltransferase [Alphaproteobacteria bacterium]
MQVFVDVRDARWKKHKINFNKIANATDSCVYKDSEVSIILTDDVEIHEINKTYRNVDRPTNVLSFELGDDVLLGDIYISYDTVMREARDENISFEDHVAHMVVHGVYHLMGCDHITDDEAAIMEMKEIKALKKLGIKNPYADEMSNCKDGSCCPGGAIVAFLKRFVVRENSWVQYALYAVFGAIASFGFAPFYCWWATIIGIAGAYWLTVRNKNIGGFWHALKRVSPFGAVYAISMFWWTLHSIYVVPELTQQFAIWTVPALVGLGFAGVVIFSWPFVAIARVWTSSPARVFLFSGVWTLVLWGREWMLTGFPWNPLANIAMPWPMLANSMSLWGALGLTFIVAGLIAVMVELLRNPRIRANWYVLGIFALMLGVGVWHGNTNMQRADDGAAQAQTMMRIVQPGQSQSRKATHNRDQALQNARENLNNLVSLARSGAGDFEVVIFPETAYPFAVVPGDEIAIAGVIGAPMIMGANTIDEHGKIYNSMVLANSNGVVEHIYSKSHLVPFGEYRPLGFLPASIDLAQGRGPERIGFAGLLFVPAICYEIIFSDSLIPDGEGQIDAIVNITNDGWFGNTPGTYQHLDMVRRYAIESGLPIVRANYSGISAFVASDGVVVSALPVGAAGAIDGFVWGAHETLYRTIGRDWWMIIIMFFACVGAIVFARTREN